MIIKHLCERDEGALCDTVWHAATAMRVLIAALLEVTYDSMISLAALRL